MWFVLLNNDDMYRKPGWALISTSGRNKAQIPSCWLGASCWRRDRLIIKLTGNQDSHRISKEFKFRPHPSWDFGVTYHWALENCCGHDSAFGFDRIFIKLADHEDRHKISEEFDFGPDRTVRFGVTCPWVSKKKIPYTYNGENVVVHISEASLPILIKF